MAPTSDKLLAFHQLSSGPRIPALHPAAPPNSSFSTPLGGGSSGGSRNMHSPPGYANDALTDRYEDFMRLMRAVNRDAMNQEVSSPYAGGAFGAAGEARDTESQNHSLPRLPIKRRHSEVGETSSIFPPLLSQPQTPIVPQFPLGPQNTSPSPSQVTAHSVEEMQALEGLQALGSSHPETPVREALPSIEPVLPASITGATTATPVTVASSIPNAKKLARDNLFDAVVAANMRAGGSTVDARGNPLPPADNVLWRRTITGPDDLERAESVRLFEILEACSYATQPDTPMTTTRGNIDRFFDAIFKNWDPEAWDAEAARTARPDFIASAEAVVGKVCGHPSLHQDISACMSKPECESDVIARVTYVYTPHSIKLEFFAKLTAESTATEDTDTLTSSRHTTRSRRQAQQAQPQTPTESQSSPPLTPVNPTDRDDIRWITATDWTDGMRSDLQKKIIARLHKYNKHQAIWQARRFVQGLARGALPEGSIFDRGTGIGGSGTPSGDAGNRRAWTGKDGEGLGFLTADGAKMSLQMVMNMR